MKDIVFRDPNIRATDTFAVNGYTVTAPIFTAEELEDVIGSTTRHADKFFSSDKHAIEALGRSLALWSKPDYTRARDLVPILSNITHFSEANIACYGLMPLGRLDFQADKIYQLPERLLDLIDSGQHQHFTPWEKGYLKGYGSPQVRTYDRPRLVLQILAGNAVGPSWMSSTLGAALHSPQIIKLPRRDLASFMVFLESLQEIAPEFRKTIACGYYSSDDSVDQRLLAQADVVMAMGGDGAMQGIRAKLARVNPGARFIEHGFKIGFQVVSREYAVPEVAELAAWGIAAHDGNACFTPANVYVERGGPLAPQEFAQELAGHLQAVAARVPPKKTLDAAQRVVNYRHSQLQRRLVGEDVRVIRSSNTDYTVVVDNQDPRLAPTCQERAAVVRPVDSVRDVPRYVTHLSDKLETIGLAVPSGDVLAMAEELGRIGATNVKLVGTEYVLSITDPHDGVFNTVLPRMSDGLRWTSVSFTDTDAALQEALDMKRNCLRLLADNGGVFQFGGKPGAEPPG